MTDHVAPAPRERRIPPRFLHLGHLLTEMNGSLRVHTFQRRFLAQQAVFLYQTLTRTDLGYVFRLDLAGAYSRTLREDYRDAFSVPSDEMDRQVQAHTLSPWKRQRLHVLKDLLHTPPAEFPPAIPPGLAPDQLQRLWPELLSTFLLLLEDARTTDPGGSGHPERAEHALARLYPDVPDAAPMLQRRLQALKLPHTPQETP